MIRSSLDQLGRLSLQCRRSILLCRNREACISLIPRHVCFCWTCVSFHQLTAACLVLCWCRGLG